MSLANFNMLVSVSKRISSNVNSKKVIINSCYIMFTLNIILISIMFLATKFISNELLNNPNTYYPLLACTLSLPFISLGYIIKGYFYGKQNMTPHMISNVLEQLFRLLIISIILPKVVKYGVVVAVTIFVLFNVFSESFSILVFLFFLPKNRKITKEDLNFDYRETKEILAISVPSVSGRLLGNIGFFLEPILLTNILLFKGSSITYITQEYGIYNGYAISTLLFPSFFIAAISNALLPEISKEYANKNIKNVKKRIKESLIISFIIGIGCTLLIYLFKDFILNTLYNTNQGQEYITVLTPFFVLFYLEAPLNSILIGLDKVKKCTMISVIGMIIKLVTMVILGFCNFKIYSLIIAEIVNIIFIVILDFITLKKELIYSS